MSHQTTEQCIPIDWEQLVLQIHDLIASSNYSTATTTVPLLSPQSKSINECQSQVEREKESIFEELKQVLRSPVKMEQTVSNNLIQSSNYNSPQVNAAIVCPASPFQLVDAPSLCTLPSLSSAAEEVEVRFLLNEKPHKFSDEHQTVWNRKRRRHFSDAELAEVQTKLQISNAKRTKFVRNGQKPYQKMVKIFTFK